MFKPSSYMMWLSARHSRTRGSRRCLVTLDFTSNASTLIFLSLSTLIQKHKKCQPCKSNLFLTIYQIYRSFIANCSFVTSIRRWIATFSFRLINFSYINYNLYNIYSPIWIVWISLQK